MTTSTMKFQLGRIVGTPPALAALKDAEQTPLCFITRHAKGDWGDVCKEDKKTNDDAIAHEGDEDKQGRLLSSYKTNKGETIWIITEWDRSVTTLLLPSDY